MKTLFTIALLIVSFAVGVSVRPIQAHTPCGDSGSSCGYKTVVDDDGNARNIWVCD